MNRFDRITAILIQLQSKRIIRAQEIADRFDISLRTVYRDIRSLEEAGIPLISEAGVGYSLVDGYRLPPVMFTKEEALAFITAEKLVEKFTDRATLRNYSSAIYKVKAVLRNTEKDSLQLLDENIEVLPRQPLPDLKANNALEVLMKGITEKKVVRLKYRAFHSGEATDRTIEPIGVFHEFNHWYTIGFCHLREDYRQFRSDRILEIQLTDTTFDKKHGPLKEYLSGNTESPALHTVVIRTSKKMGYYLEDHKYYNGFVSEDENGEHVEMTFLTPSLKGFARWYIRFADHARIVKPLSLKEDVRSLLSDISKNL